MVLKISASREALFRFLVVSAVLATRQRGVSPQASIVEVANAPFPTLDGGVRTASERSIYRWLAAWATGGIAALEPATRPAGEASAVLSASLLVFLADQKQKDPRASVPELMKRARAHGFIAPDEPIDRVTVWRAIRRMGGAPRGRRK